MAISRKYPSRSIPYDPPTSMSDPEKQAAIDDMQAGRITYAEMEQRIDDIDQVRYLRAWNERHPMNVSARNTRSDRYARWVWVALAVVVLVGISRLVIH
jgi:hypothetical protein